MPSTPVSATSGAADDTPHVPADILQILRCPVTGSPLRQEGAELVAVEDSQRRYRIEDGVSHLLAPNV